MGQKIDVGNSRFHLLFSLQTQGSRSLSVEEWNFVMVARERKSCNENDWLAGARVSGVRGGMEKPLGCAGTCIWCLEANAFCVVTAGRSITGDVALIPLGQAF